MLPLLDFKGAIAPATGTEPWARGTPPPRSVSGTVSTGAPGACERVAAARGPWPVRLHGLQQIQMLNLSHNNPEGGIPSNLGNLGQLNHLDLSCNNLRGFIP